MPGFSGCDLHMWRCVCNACSQSLHVASSLSSMCLSLRREIPPILCTATTSTRHRQSVYEEVIGKYVTMRGASGAGASEADAASKMRVACAIMRRSRRNFDTWVTGIGTAQFSKEGNELKRNQYQFRIWNILRLRSVRASLS